VRSRFDVESVSIKRVLIRIALRVETPPWVSVLLELRKDRILGTGFLTFMHVSSPVFFENYRITLALVAREIVLVRVSEIDAPDVRFHNLDFFVVDLVE
jgi:hypothetical protein